MSGIAIFGLKLPSLLQFDQQRNKDTIKHNLNALYQVKQAPCDTYLREQLDVVDPQNLRKAFTALFACFQRANKLKRYSYPEIGYLLSVDGTGYFSSPSVHCQNCCVKQRRDGSKTYYHQMLAASIVHPEHREVIPICPEPILKRDGDTKNDCERNAAKRLLRDFRREHPHIKVTVVEDALASNAPHIRELNSLNMNYILGVKPEGNKALFEWIQGLDVEELEIKKEDTIHRFRFINKIPLNDANPDLEVNFLEYWEINKKGSKRHFTWITNLEINKENAYLLMRGGRARWRIENETFKTLKNQGYHFEHNFGHGQQNLSTVMALLMMLAFLVDQLVQAGCHLFQAAWSKMISKINLWERLRSLFTLYFVNSWKDLLQAIAFGYQKTILTPDSS